MAQEIIWEISPREEKRKGLIDAGYSFFQVGNRFVWKKVSADFVPTLENMEPTLGHPDGALDYACRISLPRGG